MNINKIEKRPLISLIGAMAQDRVIGYQGQMPWHMPADLAWFKQKTLNKPVIMGRKTFESIGRPLPKRQNIVISTQADALQQAQYQAIGVDLVASLDEAFILAKPCDELFVIGGGLLYEQCLPRADRLYLTMIDLQTKGDTYFPDWHQFAWQQLFKECHQADEKNSCNYCFEIYQRT